MGTTVTTNLSIIKPDDDESIKANLPTFPGWADQNADNCDQLDRLFKASATTYSLNWNTSSGGWTLGTGGFTEGKYLRLWPKLVIVYFRVFAGTTSFAGGTGFFQFDLPLPMSAEVPALAPADDIPVGKCIYQDASNVPTSSIATVMYLPSATKCFLRPDQGGSWFNNTPVAIGQSDRFSGYLMYPTSSA